MFLSCGDALYDLFVDSPAALASSDVALAGNVGGSPLNVAVGLARLGHRSRYFTKLSNDVFGQRMVGYFARNQIDTSLCVATDQNTTLAVVETRDDGSAQYVFYIDNTADVSITLDELPTIPGDVNVVHFASYSTVVAPTSLSLAALAKRESERSFISYDPNLRLSIEPDVALWQTRFVDLAKRATLIKASDEDIDQLYGPGKEDAFVADSFSFGVALVLITRGPDGASGYLPDGRAVHVGGVNVQVVDTVGAGDTFQAASLHWLQAQGHLGAATATNTSGSSSAKPLLQGEIDLTAMLEFAIGAAAVTCTRRGADLPTLAELSA